MSFRRWNPEFAVLETERAYREASLAEDTRYSRLALWIGSTAGQVFVVNDVRLLGFSAFFFLLLGVRARV